MRNKDGTFVKGTYSLTEEQKKKKSLSLKESWKTRPEYLNGFYGSKFRNTWRSMRNRCDGNSSEECNKKYHHKGIKYQDSWYSFHNFYEDMFSTYKEGLQLDRIDNTKGYTKENCRWVTPKQNSNNRSITVHVTINGETRSLSEWADLFNVSFANVRNKYYRRYKKGKCNVEDIFNVK